MKWEKQKRTSKNILTLIFQGESTQAGVWLLLVGSVGCWYDLYWAGLGRAAGAISSLRLD